MKTLLSSHHLVNIIMAIDDIAADALRYIQATAPPVIIDAMKEFLK